MRHEYFPQKYDFEAVSPADTTRCHSCEVQSGKDTKLKKCAGCSVAVYCSTDCQKKAWPAHKQACRSKHARSKTALAIDEYPELHDAPPLPFIIRADFQTSVAVISEWDVFSAYHAWALSTAIGVAAWLAAARKSTAETPFRLDDVLVHLYVAPISRPDQDPASSWAVRCLRLSEKKHEIEVDERLARLFDKHRDDFANADAIWKAAHGARFAASLPIIHRLGVGNLVQSSQRPLFVWRNPARLLDQPTQDAMQDFLDVLRTWICSGIILKPTDPTEKMAVPGRLVQVQKKTKTTWEWTALSFTQVDRLQRLTMPKSKTRMSFAQLAQLYASL